MRKTLAINWVAFLVTVALFVSACAPAAAPPPKAAAPAPETPAPAATPKPAADAPRSGGVLAVNTSYPDPQDMDLVSDHQMVNLAILRPAFSGLLQYDPIEHGKVINDLAERWEVSPDGKVYTYYLRKGVKWHDGRPFTSADVKYTLDRMVDPNDPEKIRLMTKRDAMMGISRVDTPDPDTVKVTLQLPRGSFTAWIAWGSMIMGPKHIPIPSLANTVVGTGAFKLKTFARGSSLDMVRNPDYFIKGRPYLDGITFYIIKDASTTMAAFRTKRLQLARNILPSKVKEVKEGTPGAVVDVSDKLAFGYFGMNASRPPFGDVRVRRAASMAIDREAAIQVLAEGYGSIGTVMPPGEWARPAADIAKMPGYRKPKDIDLTEAKKLLADAGFPNGFKTTLLTSSRPEWERAAVFLKDQLGKIGIDTTINMQEQATYMKERTGTNFDVSAAGAGAAYIPDPAGHRKYYGRENFVGMKDDRIFDLIDQQDTAADKAERKKLLWEMDDKLMDNAAIVVLYWANQVTALWPEVRNFKDWAQFNNHAYTDVWLAR